MKVLVHYGEISTHSPERYYRLLSPDEKQRAGSYLHAAARECFVIRRGVLRVLLGTLLQKSPEEVLITQTFWGKPVVENIEFSSSTREGKMLFAFSYLGPVGVDIEKVDFSLDVEGMEELLFGYEEKNSVVSMDAHLRREYLFQVWAKKEAWLKAVGCGLHGDLKKYDTESCRSGWRFTSIPIDPGYIAFLATTEEVSACQHLHI